MPTGRGLCTGDGDVVEKLHLFFAIPTRKNIFSDHDLLPPCYNKKETVNPGKDGNARVEGD